jgi:hypothetical protein
MKANTNSIKTICLTGLLTFFSLLSFAQDRLFTYTYQSSVLNKGQRELEIWNTFLTGKENYFARLDNRTEFEIGLGKRLQTSFYLNLTSITNTTDENSSKSLNTEHEISFSNEWKYKLLDPVANPVGLALYAEYGIGSSEYELEGKLIIDKRIKDFTIAGNVSYELELVPEIENNETIWEKEGKNDYFVSLSYSLSPKFHLTTENVLKNVFEDGTLLHSALYSGLGFSYVHDNFWINFTALPQITSFKGNTDSSLNLNEFEKVQLRLLFSYAL